MMINEGKLEKMMINEGKLEKMMINEGKLEKVRDTIRNAYFGSNKMCFFVAAGISKDCPTHLPLANELTQALISGYFELNFQCKDGFFFLKQETQNRSLEEICEVIQFGLGEKYKLTEKMEEALDNENIPPNQNHHFLARALHNGHLVVTTNFENSIERAYQNLYNREFPKENICYNEVSLKSFQKASDKFNRERGEIGWLFKLHGSFKVCGSKTYSSVITTLDKIGKGLPSSIQNVLIHILENCPLMVMGYGCMDIDIVGPVMMRATVSHPVWWLKHHHYKNCVYNNDQIRKTLISEEDKEIINWSFRDVNPAKLLDKWAEGYNNSDIWLIEANTGQFVFALMQVLNQKTSVSFEECECNDSMWKEKLFQLGEESNRLEKLLVLARLAKICSPEAKCQDLYDLSKNLYLSSLDLIERKKVKKAKIYSEIGWDIFHQNPEKGTDKAIRYYDKAINLIKDNEEEWPFHIELLGYRILALRRMRRISEAIICAKHTWELIPEIIREGDLPKNPKKLKKIISLLGVKGKQMKSLASTLQRIAGLFDQCVSSPTTLAISIGDDVQWCLHPLEKKLLRYVVNSLKSALFIYHLAGDLLGIINHQNYLGLVYSKMGNGKMAKKVHKKSLLLASQLEHHFKYAQAIRNHALAREACGDLHGAIDDLISAKENSKIDSALFWSCLWHLGRIRIKAEKEEGIENIKVHLDKFNDWHWRANDLALLGIAQYDLKNNPKKAKIYFSLMFDEYPKRNGEIDVSKIKRHTYGTDNALANCRVALNRLKGISEDQTLCDKIQNFKLKLEKMRSQFLSESFSFLDLKT